MKLCVLYMYHGESKKADLRRQGKGVIYEDKYLFGDVLKGGN